MNNLLQDLNEPQKEAVLTTEGPVLILAGAGSGKTRALTCRVAYLIQEKGVKPWHILAITFTNKAANEMRSRVEHLVDEGADAIWISTFHSACARILRRNADFLGYTSSFTIYDADDQKTLLKQVIRQMNLNPRDYREKNVLAEISSAKNRLEDAAAYREKHAGDYRGKIISDIYEEYQKQLLQNNAMDFDDLLVNTVEVLQKDPYALEEYQERFRYILVDEYQDTNAAQFRIISLLAARHRNLCVVGDDDQSIYKFRGADIRNILDFEKFFPDAKVIRMEQNYRSTGNILDAANHVIANNEGRKIKRLWTENEAGEKVIFKRFDTSFEEGDWIVRNILRNKDTVSFGECAVLYRSNAQSRILEEKCVKYNIPYRLVGGINFYQRREIKDMICYLKTIENGRDDLAVQRILNVPRRGIGETTMEKVASYAAAHSISFFEALEQSEKLPGMERTWKKTEGFLNCIRNLKEASKTLTVQDLIEKILEETDYEAELQKEGSIEAQARMENIGELISKAAAMQSEPGDPEALSRFLEEVALVADVEEEGDSSERVTLMTLHASKGLEFTTVYMSGMEDGLFPSRLSVDSGDPGDLEEERRLCYVGMTRARKKLALCAARSRMINGETKYFRTSRFVDEIPADLLQTPGKAATSSSPSAAAGESGAPREAQRGSYLSGYRKPKAYTGILNTPGNLNYMTGKDIARVDASELGYGKGDRVRHVKFGMGTVKEITEGKSDTEVTVVFDKAGEKKLMAGFAKLAKI